MYVCMYACMYVCMYVRMLAYLHLYAYMYMYMYMCTCVSHVSYNGRVDVIMASWGDDMRVFVVVANDVHNGSCVYVYM